jgi:hydroxyacylglutathione hydrolase
MPQSTVGYERSFNWALGQEDENQFVCQVLNGQPEPPGYFREMKRVNRMGPRMLGRIALPPSVSEKHLAETLGSNAVIVDTRPAADFAAGHLPGTLSLPFNHSFPTWAGSLLPYDRDIYLLADPARPRELEQIVRTLAMIGLDSVRGYFDLAALSGWSARGRGLERTDQMAVSEVAAGRSGLVILDVRGRSEWDAGHIPGATHIPLAELPARLGELPRDRTLAVHCQGGGRSAIAAGLLKASGFASVANITGGFGAWSAAGLPVRGGDGT